MTSPSTQDSDSSALHSRILTHMNTSHTSSLSLHLQSHHSLPSYRTRHAHLTSLTLSTLTITIPTPLSAALYSLVPGGWGSKTNRKESGSGESDGETYTIPITPPLSTYSDARPVLAAMDATARHTLGVHPNISVSKYIPPERWWEWVWHIFVLVTFVVFLFPSNFREGAVVREGIVTVFGEKFGGFCRIVQPFLNPFVLAVHVAEGVWVTRGKGRVGGGGVEAGLLRWAGLETGSSLWWKWVGSVVLEGWVAQVRLLRVVKGEEMEWAKRKH